MASQPGDQRVVAFVPVRLNSTRLTFKHFRMIGDRTLLAWVLLRIKSISCISKIVVCVPSDAGSDDQLIKLCAHEGAELFVYAGEVDDVVGRLAAAAEQYAADICVMVSGDCPLAASDTLEGMINTLRAHADAGWVEIASMSNRRVVHEGLLVARAHVWRLADALSNTPELRAHQFPVLTHRPEAFAAYPPIVFRDFDHYDAPPNRISVDTPADLEFMRSVHEALRFRNERFDLRSVLKLLQCRPALKLLNSHVYQRSMKEKFPFVLFVVTAVQAYGYGNLMRSLEVADELVENFSLPSQFIVLDNQAVKICDQRGYTAHCAEFSEVSTVAQRLKAALIVFDIHSNMQIAKSNVTRLRNNGAAVVFIDNTCPASRLADAVIIPTVHHCGAAQSNLVTGADYVVIKKEVRRAKESTEKQAKLAVVYRGRATAENARAAVANLQANVSNLRILQVESYRKDFARLIASAQYVVSPLSQTSYEAVFLGAQPCLIYTDGDQRSADLFLSALPTLWGGDGRGGFRIAERLSLLAQGRIVPETQKVLEDILKSHEPDCERIYIK